MMVEGGPGGRPAFFRGVGASCGAGVAPARAARRRLGGVAILYSFCVIVGLAHLACAIYMIVVVYNSFHYRFLLLRSHRASADAACRRDGVSATEDFAQYKLQFVDYIQHDYEVIRPIVLFAETIAERSRQTGIERTSVGDKARRFVIEGMLGLVDQRVGQAGRKGHVYPEAVAAYMLYVKQLYPPIHDREVVRILQRKFGYHTNHHTVHRFFARHALPVQLELQMPVFAAFAEAYQARWTVVRMWYEGWNKQSIAGCLKLSRTHVYTILEAFARDGFAGLEEQRTRPPQHPGNQLTLPFLKEVLDIQREYPRA
jgi:hypothetical protein